MNNNRENLEIHFKNKQGTFFNPMKKSGNPLPGFTKPLPDIGVKTSKLNKSDIGFFTKLIIFICVAFGLHLAFYLIIHKFL